MFGEWNKRECTSLLFFGSWILWSHLATLGRPTETRGLDAEYAEKILKEFVPRPSAFVPRPSAGRTEPNEVRPCVCLASVVKVRLCIIQMPTMESSKEKPHPLDRIWGGESRLDLNQRPLLFQWSALYLGGCVKTRHLRATALQEQAVG